MHFELVAKSDVGRQRTRNEDNWLILADIALVAVADGMGGHIDGNIASQIAVDTLQQLYKSHYPNALPSWAPTEIPSQQEKFLIHAVQEANKNIYERNRGTIAFEGMGTTIVALQLQANYVITACVGDSRIYLLRNGTIEQITQDHSLVGELVRYNIIREKDLIFLQNKNIITRALGMAESVLVDTKSHHVFPNDIFLLCSDGLTDLVSDERICEILLQHQEHLADALTILIDEANNLGGVDNITVAIAKVHESSIGSQS